MNRADYDRYLAAFNAREYEGVAAFYAEPLRLDFFGVALRSRADLVRFYRFLHSYVEESVRVLNFAASPTLTAVDAEVRIAAYRDLDAETLAANGCGGLFPIAAGEVKVMRQAIFYRLDNGLIVQTECALLPPAS